MKSPNHGHQRGAGLLPWRMTGQPRSPAPRGASFQARESPGQTAIGERAPLRLPHGPVRRAAIDGRLDHGTRTGGQQLRGPPDRPPHPWTRWNPSRRGDRCAGISRRGGRVRRRAPRRGHLLRPLRLPHHLAAGRRMVEDRDPLLPPLLRAPGPEAPPRPLHPPPARRRLRPVVRRDRHVEHAARRRPGHDSLRRQLALHLLRAELFRAFRSALAAPAHLVAGGRGAVLPGLAGGGPLRPAPGRTAGARRGGGGQYGRLGGADPGAPAPGGQRVAALLRHRHARPGSDGRCGAGHRRAGHRPSRAGLAVAGDGCRWARRPVPALGAAQRERSGEFPLPGRVLAGGRGQRGGDPARLGRAPGVACPTPGVGGARLHRPDLLRALPLPLSDISDDRQCAHRSLGGGPAGRAAERDLRRRCRLVPRRRDADPSAHVPQGRAPGDGPAHQRCHRRHGSRAGDPPGPVAGRAGAPGPVRAAPDADRPTWCRARMSGPSCSATPWP